MRTLIVGQRCSGKTIIAQALYEQGNSTGRRVYVYDLDNFRKKEDWRAADALNCGFELVVTAMEQSTRTEALGPFDRIICISGVYDRKGGAHG